MIPDPPAALRPASFATPQKRVLGARTSHRAAHGGAAAPLKEDTVIILGVILLVIGLITGIAALWTIGIILLAVGAVLWILGAMGHAVAGHRHYW